MDLKRRKKNRKQMCEILSLSYYGETLLKIDEHKKLCLEAHLLVLLYIAEAKLCILS
jgi:hypothetical protein